MTGAPERGVIALLTAQALAFGVMLALLVIPANAIFLNEYGPKWLPATYIAIAVLGTSASALIARASRRTKLVRVATVSLSVLAVLYAASWLVLVADGVWVSALLLVLFPIALQMGFVFIGGQAGRLLDVRQMKERFPRVVGGFTMGFLVGGLLAIPLLSLLGSTEHLLVATTVAQLGFLALLVATDRRFPEVRAAPTEPSEQATRRPPARALFASTLVALLLVYQVMSAMGSWLLDYVFFNRAQAHYSGDDLTQFLSVFTGVLNLVDLLFLALVAGALMRRFGLRIGLVLNPAVVAVLLAVMAVIAAVSGTGVYSLFVLAAVTRVSDIALTDGTTRTSVNASFQMVPVGDRVAVQAVVEGIGVPVAIGATGAILLIMNLIGVGVGGVIAFAAVLSVFWTLSGAAMYRSYTRALADEMRRRSVVEGAYEIAEDDAALQALLRSDDPRDVRLGLDLLPGVVSADSADALRELSEHGDPETRLRALAQLAAAGDREAASAAATLAGDLARSPDPPDRRAAASATADTSTLIELLADPDATVRAAALDGVSAEHAGESEVVRRVVVALEDSRTAGHATGALRRLGDPAVPLVAAALSRVGAARPQALIRAAANAASEHGLAVIEPALRDPDRVVVLTALDALDSADGAGVVPPDLLDRLFDDAAAHAARAVAARESLAASDGPLRRALEDEIELARRLVIAVLALRHGDRVRNAVRVVDRADGQRRALGVEALDVLVSREEAAIALPLIRGDLAPDGSAAPDRSREEWIANLAEDPESEWRSSWLALSARHTAQPA